MDQRGRGGSTRGSFPRLIFQLTKGELTPKGRDSLERGALASFVRNVEHSPPSRFHKRELFSPVYGLEWCRNGTLLLSAHSDGVIAIHDRRTEQNVLKTKPDILFGHYDAVNGCTEISYNYFASYSDDTTVLVWDLRMMKTWEKKCMGHMNWVKNVNVMSDGKALVTSGCDQSVRIYDLQDPEPVLFSHPSLYFDGLCRTRLNPLDNTLYITTWRTNVLAIKNLNLEHLEKDALNYYLTAMKEVNCKTNKYVPPFAKTRNRLDIVHYVPYNGNYLSSGQSLAIHPQGSCCAVRCIREESSSFNPKKKLEWLSVYDLASENIFPSSSEEVNQQPCEEDNYSQEFYAWLKNVNWDLLEALDKWRIWKRVRMTDKVELDLLRNVTLTKLRLSMLYSQWNETDISPQLICRSKYYNECASFSDGLIKEISFSHCGRLILDPTPNGFQILGFDSDINNYSPNTGAEETNEQCKRLTVLKEVDLRNTPPRKCDNCLCAKLSPDNSVIVSGTLEGKVTWFKTPSNMNN